VDSEGNLYNSVIIKLYCVIKVIINKFYHHGGNNMSCENCKFRAKYDKDPKSLLGRIWRWHIGFCPGWKQYYRHLPDDKKAELIKRYNL